MGKETYEDVTNELNIFKLDYKIEQKGNKRIHKSKFL